MVFYKISDSDLDKILDNKVSDKFVIVYSRYISTKEEKEGL
jgi:hypothetical protein